MPKMIVPSTPTQFDIAGAQQVIVEKQSLDCFDNANLNSILKTLDADRYVVYGMVTEYCVVIAAHGLLRLGRPVEIVTDAIETLRAANGEAALRKFTQAGGTMTTLAGVVGL